MLRCGAIFIYGGILRFSRTGGNPHLDLDKYGGLFEKGYVQTKR